MTNPGVNARCRVVTAQLWPKGNHANLEVGLLVVAPAAGRDKRAAAVARARVLHPLAARAEVLVVREANVPVDGVAPALGHREDRYAEFLQDVAAQGALWKGDKNMDLEQDHQEKNLLSPHGIQWVITEGTVKPWFTYSSIYVLSIYVLFF